MALKMQRNGLQNRSSLKLKVVNLKKGLTVEFLDFPMLK